MTNGKYEGTIGSAVAVMKSNGEIFAKPHPHKLTGYKAKNSETNTKTLGSSTTYKEFHSVDTKASSGKKAVPGPLVPYHENAMRNRMPVKFPNEAIKGARFCAPRNVSTISLGGPTYARQYQSTNKNDFVPHSGLPVGFTNQGVMSEQTKWTHHKQKQ